MKISQRAFDLIVAEEVSSKAYYIQHYQHPEWPGGASGITIGIGYDLGYASKAKITMDWAPLVSAQMLAMMVSCSGVSGDAARRFLTDVSPRILIPWDAALAVFANRDMPEWTTLVQKALPNTEKLTPTCLGVLVSISYNRGVSFANPGDRYAEMRSIKAHMASGNFAAIPNDIRAMKRLWPKVKGLRDRREHEAVLFEQGLSKIDILAKVGEAPDELDLQGPFKAGPARTKPPTLSLAQHTAAFGAVTGGGLLLSYLHAGGMAAANLGVLASGLTASMTVLGVIWFRQRNPTWGVLT